MNTAALRYLNYVGCVILVLQYLQLYDINNVGAIIIILHDTTFSYDI